MNYEEMIKNVEEILIKYKESLAKDPTIDYRNFAAHEIADIVFKAGIKEVTDFIDNLIMGIDGCEFEERHDGDKGCIVLDMNENQWDEQKKEWGL